MITSQDHSSSFEYGDPTGDFQALSTFVNNYQIKNSFWEIFAENSVIGAHIGAANNIHIIQDLLDGLLLQVENLIPKLFDLSVNGTFFLTGGFRHAFAGILQFLHLVLPCY